MRGGSRIGHASARSFVCRAAADSSTGTRHALSRLARTHGCRRTRREQSARPVAAPRISQRLHPMLCHPQFHRRQVKDLATFTPCDSPIRERLATTATPLRSMDHHLVRLADLFAPRATMTRLPAGLLVAALPQARGALLHRRRISRRRTRRVGAVFRPPRFSVPALCARRQMSGGVLAEFFFQMRDALLQTSNLCR